MLVHFKSRDLARLQSQGQFWHVFFLHGGALISQDEKETWTVHQMVPHGTDPDNVDALDFVYRVLGGLVELYPVRIDEVLVKSIWRADIGVADSFRSTGGRVFLAGDAGETRAL